MEPLQDYHRVMVAEDFLSVYGDKYWPKGKRYSMCWLPENMRSVGCKMKEGNIMRFKHASHFIKIQPFF